MLSCRQPFAACPSVQLGRCMLPMVALLIIVFESPGYAQTDSLFFVVTYIDVQSSADEHGSNFPAVSRPSFSQPGCGTLLRIALLDRVMLLA